ncbi:cohesin subunit SA-2-like [Hyaena hyaena]|uniref:cohesin subunit SA-2-like n=1 Tax=Hyaena hyaena TaxID=95912 RepID=UPI001923485B|nr:cohesin subunit SA-2-like [Hyaena hyaena]
MSRHFVKVLPQLLSKFAADKEKVTPLLQIPQYCNLEVYDRDGLGSYLDSALLELDCLVQRHSDVAVLEACARAYGAYCHEGGFAQCHAGPACSRLVDMLVDALTPLLDVFIQHEKQGQFLGHREMGRICSTLRRLVAFYSTHDLSSWNLYEKMDSLLTFRRHQGGLPTEVVHCALQCTYYALLWQIVAATDRLPPQAFILLCDLLLILSHQGPEDDTGLGLLFFVPDQVLQARLLAFLREHVFLEEPGSEGSAERGAGGPEQETQGLSGAGSEPQPPQDDAWTPEHPASESPPCPGVPCHTAVPGARGPGRRGGRRAVSPGPSRIYTEEDADELHQLFHRRNMLAVFCKLVVYNVLDISAAAEIYQFYLQHYHHFGDILKETMTRTRQNDRLRNALSLLLCLQQLFQKHMDKYGLSYDPIEFICGPFYSIRLLARRFALTLGFDRAREAAHLIHRRGLAYAFSEVPVAEDEGGRQRFPNLSFLLLLAEFSCKIPPAERGAALAHFQDSIPEGVPSFGEKDMNPLLVYRKSLTKTDEAAQGDDDEEEEPAANPFDAICKESKRPQELPAATCSSWTADAAAAGAPEPRNPSRSPDSARDVFDVDFLSEDSDNSSAEDVDVEGISVQGGSD